MSACAEFEPIVVDVAPNSPEWLAKRRDHLGASEAAVILGMSKWGSPAEVQASKLEDAVKEMSEAMERGHLLEPLIRWAVSDLKGVQVGPGKMFVHPDHPWMAATTDGELDQDTILEIKTVNDRAFKNGEWGADGTDEVPENYLIQVMHQMAVTGAKACVLAALAAPAETLALIAGMAKGGAAPEMLVAAIKEIGLHFYEIQRNDALIADMIEAEGEWWQTHIVNREPAVDVALLKDNGSILQATPEQDKILKDLREARDLLEEAEAAEKLWTDAVKKMIGESSGIKGAEGQVTWKKAKDTSKTVVDWEAVAVSMATETKLVDLFNALVKDNTREDVKPGARRFLCPRSWSKKEAAE